VAFRGVYITRVHNLVLIWGKEPARRGTAILSTEVEAKNMGEKVYGANLL